MEKVPNFDTLFSNYRKIRYACQKSRVNSIRIIFNLLYSPPRHGVTIEPRLIDDQDSRFQGFPTQSPGSSTRVLGVKGSSERLNNYNNMHLLNISHIKLLYLYIANRRIRQILIKYKTSKVNNIILSFVLS